MSFVAVFYYLKGEKTVKNQKTILKNLRWIKDETSCSKSWDNYRIVHLKKQD